MYRELEPELLLALMSANLEPLSRCSDGLWRSTQKLFPPPGIPSADVDFLMFEGLVEMIAEELVLTVRGAETLLRGGIFNTEQASDAAIVLN